MTDIGNPVSILAAQALVARPARLGLLGPRVQVLARRVERVQLGLLGLLAQEARRALVPRAQLALARQVQLGRLVRAVQDAANGGAPLSPALNALLVDRYRELQSNKSDSLGLSERQAKVLEMVARGETTKRIAEDLFLSPATVKRELRHVFDLMGVNNRAHAVSEAQRRGLI